MVENKEIMEEKKEDEPFDHLDLSIDLRKRPDLRKKMTPEMKAERQRKQIKTIYEKKWFTIFKSKGLPPPFHILILIYGTIYSTINKLYRKNFNILKKSKGS